MKKKIFMFLACLASFTLASAQTDVTKFFLTNYGFDSNFDYPATSSAVVKQEIKQIDGWTQGFTINYTISGIYEFGFKGTFNDGKVPSTGYDNEAGGGLALSTGWGEQFYYTQTVTLPAGKYTLSVPTYNGKNATAGTSLVAWIPNTGTQVSSKVSGYPYQQWTLDKIAFELNSTTTGIIRIGYQAGANSSSGSANLVIDYVRLEGIDMDVKPLLQEVLDHAIKLYGNGAGNGAAELKEAIDIAKAVYDDAESDVTKVLETKDSLNAAIEAYNVHNISEDNPLDVTNLINNPSFETGGLSKWKYANFSPQTNASFKKKAGNTYIEKWVSSGSLVGDASVSQVLKLPYGIYKMTVGAQNLNQAKTTQQCEGAYVYAGSNRTPVYTPNDYSVTFTCISGEIEIGFNAIGATGNWLCVDNFRLAQIGEIDFAGVLNELNRMMNEAEALQTSMMSSKAAEALSAAITKAKEVTSETSDATIHSIAKSLIAAIDAANVSIAEYAALQDAIDAALDVYDATKAGADVFFAEIEKAKELMKNADATSKELAEEIEKLKNAELLFYVANGTGTAPKVTTNTSFFIPAAHGALIRATFSGSNFKERGICWSTTPEPTIADHRSTDYYNQKGMLFHIKDMSPASVYYVRAYAISKTYAVGYGDVMKVVTLPQGSCNGTWDNGAPDEAANTRCRNAIQETMDYLNEWTAIKGFTLSGHYGASTPTADCSYGGYMRIGPNAGNQAIGTVIHETGHGVGVGTHWRWYNCSDLRENTTHGKWLGAWANKTLRFLEGTTSLEVFMTGDGTHGWGSTATGSSQTISYDWFVNGADKDKHTAIQYIGGCALLYSLYIDGLCPTSGYSNGVAGYTFNFDADKKYYIKSESADRGLKDGYVCVHNPKLLRWKTISWSELNDSAAWYVEYLPATGLYRFKNAATGLYMTRGGGVAASVGVNSFQLMPGHNDVIVGSGTKKYTSQSYWLTWSESEGDKSLEAKALSQTTGVGQLSKVSFSLANSAKAQRYIFISEDDIANFEGIANPDGIKTVQTDDFGHVTPTVIGVYTLGGVRLEQPVHGINVLRYSDGSSRVVVK